MSISINQRQRQEAEFFLSHIKKGAEKALVRAINHTLAVVKTEAGQEIRKQVRLKTGYTQNKLGMQKANYSNLEGRITTPARGLLLSHYPNTRYKRGGIGVQIKPGNGKKKKLPGAFLMTFANGHTGIMIRTKRGAGLGRSEGLKVLYGPSLSQVFTDVKDDLKEPSGDRLVERLNHEIQYLLSQQLSQQT